MHLDTGLSDRLATLEVANRRLRRGLTTLTAGFLLLVGAGVTGLATRTDAYDTASTDSLRLRELVIVDANGVERVRIGASLPDAVISGRRVHRGDAAAGIILYDSTGQERSGYVTFDRSGTVLLTLDTHEGQVALFAADADGGAAARLWNGGDWVEMRSGEDGTRLSAGRNDTVVVQIPEMTAAESEALCTGLRQEVAGISPPPPDAAVLAACRRRASDAVCRACLRKP